MKPKAITELIDRILATAFHKLTTEDLSTDNQALVDKVNELKDFRNKLLYPNPKETVYKKRNPEDNSNFVIYNDNLPDGGFYTSKDIGKLNKRYKTFGEAVDSIQEDINSKAEQNRPDVYKSSHFNETNVLAHTRLNERTDSDGKKVLFVEEIQSDWHQAGRKKVTAKQ